MIEEYTIHRDDALATLESAIASRDRVLMEIVRRRNWLHDRRRTMAETGVTPFGTQTLQWDVEQSGVLINAAEADVAKARYVVDLYQRYLEEAVAATAARQLAGLPDAA